MNEDHAFVAQSAERESLKLLVGGSSPPKSAALPPPDRASVTGDGSLLLQYLTGSTQGCVDIYPNGEVVVVIREGDMDNVYDGFSISELREVASLLAASGIGHHSTSA